MPVPVFGTSASDYQNFIYLFNNHEELRFSPKDGLRLHSSGHLTAMYFSSSLTLAHQKIGMEIKSDKYFPFKDFAREKLPDEVWVGETYRLEGNKYLIKKTNDPLHPPWNFHAFDEHKIGVYPDALQSIEYFYNYQHDDVSGEPEWSYVTGEMIDTNSQWFFKIPTDVPFLGTEIDVGGTAGMPVKPTLPGGKDHILLALPNAAERKDKTLGPSNPPLKSKKDQIDFLFHQEVDFATQVHDYTDDDNDNWTAAVIANEKVQAAFDWYYWYLGYMGGVESIKDNSFMAGIPYDFQTVLKNDLNEKGMGVKFAQPSYEKIYNYYDPQYDATAYAVAEEISDEVALPSIYDFLYLPVNPYLFSFLAIPNMSVEETTLGNLNHYLDLYAQYYETFIEDPEAIDMTIGELLAVFTSQQNMLGGTLNGTNETILEFVNNYEWPDLEGVLHLPTEKEIIIGSLTSIAIDQKSLSLIKQSNPLWINQSKVATYFSEKSMDIFNQTIDKDSLFPQLIKINIPSEPRGPIAQLLSKKNLLDSINTYAASLAISEEQDRSTYSSYHGAVINAISSTSFNTLLDAKFKSFRIFFEKWQSLTAVDAINMATKSYSPVLEAKADAEKVAAAKAAAEEAAAEAAPVEVEEALAEIAAAKTMTIIRNSWRRAQIRHFHKLIIEPFKPDIDPSPSGYEPYKIITYWSFPKGNNPGDHGEILPNMGAILNIFANCADDYVAEEYWCPDSKIVGNYIAHHTWTGAAFTAEKDLLEEEGTLTPWIPLDTDEELIYEIPPSATESIPNFSKLFEYSARPAYESDLYIDTTLQSPLSSVIVYGDKEDTISTNSKIKSLIKKFQASSFKKELRNLFTEKGLLRTPVDIQNGKLAHQETIMYEIAKYAVDKNKKHKNPHYYIQSIFLPQTEQENLSYYDTQIIPEKDYFYKIFAHKIIVGTEYRPVRYSNIGQAVFLSGFNYYGDDTIPYRLFYKLKYEVMPYFEIIRVPFYNQEVVNIKEDKLNYSRVEDSPPLSPQVQVVPFRNINNKLLFLFNNSIGRVEEYPQIVFQQEKEFFNNIALSQDKLPGQKLIFKSDDSMGKFQVYRMESLPESYDKAPESDEFMVKTIEHGTEDKNTSYVDTVIPNKYYYYFFRFVDLHDKLSNPTVVYKIKIISSTGITPYVTVDIVDINELQKKKYEKNFSPIKNLQKYLYIEPSVIQNTVTTPTISEDVDESEGSYLKEPVWLGNPKSGAGVFGRKFKLRISSKETGRKMDINLTVASPETIINDS